MAAPLFVFLIAVGTPPGAPTEYPRRELLVEAEMLAKAENIAALRIFDVRNESAYRAGHVPGALRIDHAKWSKRFAEGQDADEWARLLGECGIDIDTPVVVYDDGAVKDAARIWWILRYWGVKNVQLLNGGWKAWQEANGKVSKDIATVSRTTPKLVADKQRLAFKDQVLDALRSKKYQIIDARSKDEHCGRVKLAKRNGTIPGAAHRDWADLVDTQTGRFKTADELARIFDVSGIDLRRPAMTYCQSGGRSSVMAFALELMGADDVRNYYRSWAEWGNADDTPVEKPKAEK